MLNLDKFDGFSVVEKITTFVYNCTCMSFILDLIVTFPTDLRCAVLVIFQFNIKLRYYHDIFSQSRGGNRGLGFLKGVYQSLVQGNVSSVV